MLGHAFINRMILHLCGELDSQGESHSASDQMQPVSLHDSGIELGVSRKIIIWGEVCVFVLFYLFIQPYLNQSYLSSTIR